MQKILLILGLTTGLLLFQPALSRAGELSDTVAANASKEENSFFSSCQPELSGSHRPKFQGNAACDFQKVRWGMSPSEVEAVMGSRPTRHDTNRKSGVYRMGYKDTDLFGVKIWTIYSFTDDRLWGAGYAKDYAADGEFEIIASEALAYYGKVEPLVENNSTEYQWETEGSRIYLRLTDDPRLGKRIFFNYISEELAPEPVIRRNSSIP